MNSLKKALERAEEKTQKAVGGSGGGKAKEERVSATKVVVADTLDDLTKAALEEFKTHVAGAKTLRERLGTHAQKVKELAVASSNLSGDCHKLFAVENAATLHLKQASLAWVKLNHLGERLEELVREVASLEKLEFTSCGALAEKVAKRGKAVEHMRKKNDANTLTEERGLQEDIEHLRHSLANCKTKYQELVSRVSAAWISLCAGAADALARDLVACSAVEVPAPQPL